jgi:hypothetical protein
MAFQLTNGCIRRRPPFLPEKDGLTGGRGTDEGWLRVERRDDGRVHRTKPVSVCIDSFESPQTAKRLAWQLPLAWTLTEKLPGLKALCSDANSRERPSSRNQGALPSTGKASPPRPWRRRRVPCFQGVDATAAPSVLHSGRGGRGPRRSSLPPSFTRAPKDPPPLARRVAAVNRNWKTRREECAWR